MDPRQLAARRRGSTRRCPRGDHDGVHYPDHADSLFDVGDGKKEVIISRFKHPRAVVLVDAPARVAMDKVLKDAVRAMV